jgi:ATP adenylyltransferase
VLQSLFAPWRFDYVTRDRAVAVPECIFCRAFSSTADRSTWTLWRWESSFALLNAYPYTSGHCMVAPQRHVAGLHELERSTLAEIMEGAQALVECLREVYSPHGFNVGLNLGQAAGAGIEEHLHLHIVPRWQGDTDMMTVIGRTRVHPEDLDRSFDRLVAALSRRLGSGE